MHYSVEIHRGDQIEKFNVSQTGVITSSQYDNDGTLEYQASKYECINYMIDLMNKGNCDSFSCVKNV